MSDLLNIIAKVVDPRGRCNRKGLLILMLVTLFLQACFAAAIFGFGLSFNGPVAWTIKIAFLWIAISASIQRLHDVGKSGWCLLGSFVGIIVWMVIWIGVVPFVVALNFGFEYVRAFSPLFYVFVVMSYIPLIAGALWLHFRKGESKANRYGPVPDGSGFARRDPPETRVDAGAVAASQPVPA